jgi:hypothetical protein
MKLLHCSSLGTQLAHVKPMKPCLARQFESKALRLIRCGAAYTMSPPWEAKPQVSIISPKHAKTAACFLTSLTGTFLPKAPYFAPEQACMPFPPLVRTSMACM